MTLEELLSQYDTKVVRFDRFNRVELYFDGDKQKWCVLVSPLFKAPVYPDDDEEQNPKPDVHSTLESALEAFLGK